MKNRKEKQKRLKILEKKIDKLTDEIEKLEWELMSTSEFFKSLPDDVEPQICRQDYKKKRK